MVKDNLDSWETYTGGNFLKVEHVKGENHPFVCVNVEETINDKKKSIVRLIFQSDQEEYIYDLNATNNRFIIQSGIKSPRACIGKKFFFRKTKANNPATKQEVDTLRINKIEAIN